MRSRTAQELDAPLDRLHSPHQMGLHLEHDLRRISVGRLAKLIGTLAGIADDLGGLLLGTAEQLVLARHDLSPGGRLAKGSGGLRLRLLDQAALLLYGPAGLLDLVGKALPEAVDQLECLLPINDDGPGQR